ncbi:MAG: hypothetical protein P8Y23_03125 [Candidatus Lokiarchaeota archaeon]
MSKNSDSFQLFNTLLIGKKDLAKCDLSIAEEITVINLFLEDGD